VTRTTALARLALPLAALLAGPALRAGEESAAALARGDAAWAGRAAGHRGGRAAPEPIAAAVAACEEALRHDPQSLEAHWKLMRALWFQGDYATADAAARRDLFARGRELGERAKQLLAARAGAGKELAKLPPAERARRLAAEPDAAPVHFWAAVHWGLWGEAFGKLAAARQGVAGRIRDDAETVVALDERFEHAGGLRVLGRLHDQAPRVPLVTGWIDRERAVASLRRAVQLAPESLYNRLYLAEALLAHRPAARAEAEALLAEILARPPAPAELVEESRHQERARELLAGRG